LTVFMKLCTSSYLSKSSTPSLHLTVTGIDTYFCISLVISATFFGFNINTAPKQPSLVLGLGHPQFIFTSSNP
jgi:hypothetical protein